MDFIKKLEKIFLILLLSAMGYLSYSWYQSYLFKHSELSDEIQKRVEQKRKEVLLLIERKYNLHVDIPLIISDKFHSNLYGLTAYKDKKIEIYLNKKRFKESAEYMIEEVIAHEYAHAMVFALGERNSDDGHTQLWQRICFELEGKHCERYVDNEEIVRQKMGM